MTPSQLGLFPAPTTAGRVRATDPSYAIHARARRSDPETSHNAAAAIGLGVERAVYQCFRHYGPMHDDLLVERLNATIYGPTARSARSRLSKRGLLADSGDRAKSDRGRDSIIWRLA